MSTYVLSKDELAWVPAPETPRPEDVLQLESYEVVDPPPWRSTRVHKEVPIAFKATPVALPSELLLLIIEHLVALGLDAAQDAQSGARNPARAPLLKLSTVCRQWARQLRPILFSHLVLRCYDDLQFLLTMLGAAHNEWLPSAVTLLQVIATSRNSQWIDFVSRKLARKLPSLQTIIYCPTSQLGAHDFSMPPSARFSFSNFASVQAFTICSFRFPSFSAFARLMAELPNLTYLTCLRVTWTLDPEESSDRPPTRSNSFQKLIKVYCEQMDVPWAMVWLFAPSLARRRSPSADYAFGCCPDATLMVAVFKTLLKLPKIWELTHVELRMKRDCFGIALGFREVLSFMATITLWPSVDVSRDLHRSVVRAVILLLPEKLVKSSDFDPDDWRRLDSTLGGRTANNLDYLIVRYGGRHSWYTECRDVIMPHFPRLRELRRFQFRMQKPKPDVLPLPGTFNTIPLSALGVSGVLLLDLPAEGVPLVQDPDYPTIDEPLYSNVIFRGWLEDVQYCINIQGYEPRTSPAVLKDTADTPEPVAFTLKTILEHLCVILEIFFDQSADLKVDTGASNIIELDKVGAEDIRVTRILRFGNLIQPMLAYEPEPHYLQ